MLIEGDDAAAWEARTHMLLTRCGGYCEARTPDCLTAAAHDPRDRGLLPAHRSGWSIHHRRPRGAGGTRRGDVHCLSVLMAVCGSGVAGCHGWIEANRDTSRRLGWLVPINGAGEAVDPAAVPVLLPSGRWVLLDPAGVYVRPE